MKEADATDAGAGAFLGQTTGPASSATDPPCLAIAGAVAGVAHPPRCGEHDPDGKLGTISNDSRLTPDGYILAPNGDLGTTNGHHHHHHLLKSRELGEPRFPSEMRTVLGGTEGEGSAGFHDVDNSFVAGTAGGGDDGFSVVSPSPSSCLVAMGGDVQRAGRCLGCPTGAEEPHHQQVITAQAPGRMDGDFFRWCFVLSFQIVQRLARGLLDQRYWLTAAHEFIRDEPSPACKYLLFFLVSKCCHYLLCCPPSVSV